MIEFANISLALAMGVAIYSMVASFVGVRRGATELIESSRRGTVAVLSLLTLSSSVLFYALATHDFRLSYVANYSSREMSPGYLLASFYAGNEGSLLFWAWLLALFIVIVVIGNRRGYEDVMPYATAVLMIVQAFFVVLVFLVANPFQALAFLPADGRGLNPLLENPGMLVHPPSLLAGYAGFAIPFAFAIAGLAAGRNDLAWQRKIRLWALVSWLLLGVGNLLGAQWAYVELGWGGYWAWDPVENAGLLPWLSSLALLHSLVSERTRGMFRVWNVALIVLTFELTVLGTFLARSGILSSLHTYKESALTPFFMVFLIVGAVGPAVLIARRWDQLRDRNVMESWLSRDGGFLLASILLVVATVAVLFGTIFPVFYEAGTGRQIQVTASFFNQAATPLFLAVVVLMGICPFFFRRPTPGRLVRDLAAPACVAVVVAAVMAAFRAGEWYVILAFAVNALVFAGMVVEWAQGFRARRRSRQEAPLRAFCSMIWANRPRYGGYIVHFAMVLIAVGVIGSTAYKVEKEATLDKGQAVTVGRYTLTYEGIAQQRVGKQDVLTARMYVESDGSLIDILSPAKAFHDSYDQPVTEVAIRSNLREDLYVILGSSDRQGTATFKVVVNPLVMWMWIGGGILLVGSVIALWPGGKGREAEPGAARPGSS